MRCQYHGNGPEEEDYNALLHAKAKNRHWQRRLGASRIVRSHFLEQIDRSQRELHLVPLSSPHFTGLEYHSPIASVH